MKGRWVDIEEWATYLEKNKTASDQYREMPIATGHVRASDPSGCLVCGAKTNSKSGRCMRCRTEET